MRVTADAAKERRADQELLGLEVSADERHAAVRIGEIHVAPSGRLYGGAGVALASAAVEAATGRRLVWITTQFVGACDIGDLVELTADVLAAGRMVSQVQVRAHARDGLVFQALAAAGEGRSRIPDGTIPQPPPVPPPAGSTLQRVPPSARSGNGFFGAAERRRAGSGENRWWIRLPGHELTRPALLGLAGDCLPGMVMQGIGEPGAGTSLDNTIRVGAPATGEWVLIDGMPEIAVGGFGHGHVRLWALDGTLAGTASQSASLWRSLK